MIKKVKLENSQSDLNVNFIGSSGKLNNWKYIQQIYGRVGI